MKIGIKILPAICLLIAGAVFGHSGATGIVKKRMDAMQEMRDHSKLVADMFKGKIEFNKAAVLDAANVFSTHGQQMADFFPNTEHSRTSGDTEALPRIWNKPDEFEAELNEFITLSESLIDTASTTDDVKLLKKAYQQTAKGCYGCHKRFRKPKD